MFADALPYGRATAPIRARGLRQNAEGARRSQRLVCVLFAAEVLFAA